MSLQPTQLKLVSPELLQIDWSDGQVHQLDCEVFWRTDGSSVPVEYTSTPIIENGEITGAVVVFRDISERKEIERQREEVGVAARQVAVWQQQLDDTVIRAPFTGVVVAKNAQPGEMISPISAGGGFTRTGIGTIVDMSSLEIEVDVNEAYINRVSAGQKVEARLDSYPDWPIPCHVIAIIPTADRQRATVSVRVGFEALDPRILPDMGVKVAFQESAAAEGPSSRVVLPKSAVRREGDREVVLVVVEGQVERRAVTIGESRGEEVYVSSGIAAGEKVVIAGPADLAEGDSVKEIEP